MKKEITLKDRRVTYTLRKSKRAYRMRLAVYCNGSVVVTAPHNLRKGMIERFIKEKAEWLCSKINYFKQFKGNSLFEYNHEDYLKYKNEAYNLICKRVEYFNNAYGYKFNKINIKNQRTRWGSCSKKGNLNFNYKIFFLPERIRDYIIVHELCHLKEFNHSYKFWDLVKKTYPDYRDIKYELIKYSI